MEKCGSMGIKTSAKGGKDMSLFMRNSENGQEVEGAMPESEAVKECESVAEEGAEVLVDVEELTFQEGADKPLSEIIENPDKTCDKPIGECALHCFGWDERKTEKWLVKSARFWYAVMSFLWFMIGALTFAPVIFISHKVDVLFHDRKKSMCVACAIYVAIVAIIVLLVLF